jgi:hypothetical protein
MNEHLISNIKPSHSFYKQEKGYGSCKEYKGYNRYKRKCKINNEKDIGGNHKQMLIFLDKSITLKLSDKIILK